MAEATQAQIRAQELLEQLWLDGDIGEKIRKAAKAKFPDAKILDDTVAPFVAPLKAENAALKERLDKMEADRAAEREAAVMMITAQAPAGGVTLGADKNYATQGCVAELRDAGVTPHVAQNTGRRGGSAIDGRTTRHPGYALSQRVRKRGEEIFGWLKTVGGMRKTRFRGKARVGWMFTWALAAYNLVRMRNLLREAEG